MTQSEIEEIKDAIALCHHLCDEDPLSGRYYKLLKANLPVLEYAVNPVKVDEGIGTKLLIGRMALSIARVINEKPVMNILEEKVKKDVKSSFQVIEPGTKPAAKYTKKMGKAKDSDRLYVDFPISKKRLAELKAEGRVIEKQKKQ